VRRGGSGRVGRGVGGVAVEGGAEGGGGGGGGGVGWGEGGRGMTDGLLVGDALLLETYPSFVSAWGESDHFALVRRVCDSAPPRHALFKDKVCECVVYVCCYVCTIYIYVYVYIYIYI
jgi:hypothetical protein